MSKRKSIQQQIDKINMQINAWEEKISTMKEERKHLIKQQRDADLKHLYQVIEHKGLHLSQVFDIINDIK